MGCDSDRVLRWKLGKAVVGNGRGASSDKLSAVEMEELKRSEQPGRVKKK